MPAFTLAEMPVSLRAKLDLRFIVPELPEVETLRRGLEHKTLHQRIVGAEVANAKVLKGQAEEVFRARVTGRRIEKVARRGKYLLVMLGPADVATEAPVPADDVSPSPIILCLHLKMRGLVRVQPAELPAGAYHCVSLLLDNGEAIRFYDMWTWGEIRALTVAEVSTMSGLSGMGPEPLDSEWSAELLTRSIAQKRTAIKPTLLNQAILAGVGNIYADESLFRAKLHPQRVANSLTVEEVERLAREIRAVLTEAVTAGGTSSEEFVDTDGKIGSYRPQVYDRGGEACQVCGTTLTRIRLGGRGTVFCSTCQPAAADT